MNQNQDKGIQETQGTEGQGVQPSPQTSQDGGQSQKQTGQSQGQTGINRTGRESGSSGGQVKSAR